MHFELKQFDGMYIKTLETFEASFGTKERFEIVSIVVVDCKKSHKLIGTDVLKVDTQKLINNVKVENQDISTLKGYKATVKLK